MTGTSRVIYLSPNHLAHREGWESGQRYQGFSSTCKHGKFTELIVDTNADWKTHGHILDILQIKPQGSKMMKELVEGQGEKWQTQIQTGPAPEGHIYTPLLTLLEKKQRPFLQSEKTSERAKSKETEAFMQKLHWAKGHA